MNREEAIAEISSFAKKTNPAIIFLIGDLGAGKTHFTNQFEKSIGVFKTLPSPTFTFLQEYDCNWESKKKIVHCDLYRIEPEKAERTLEQIGFWDYLEANSIIFIEWPERAISQIQALPHITLTITLLDQGERNYELS